MTNTETVSTERLAFLRLWAEQSEDEITLKASEVRELLASHTQSPAEPVAWVTKDILAAMKRGERAVPGWKPSTDFCIPLYAGSIPAPERSNGEMGVMVKPLEWVDGERGFPTDANTIIGRYRVWDFDGEDSHYMRPEDRAGLYVGGNLDHAKAAAQADYEQRIKSTLETPPLHKEGEAFDMLAHLGRQREWSEKTFGPGPRTAGVIDHIRKELREIEADPSDISEWIDVVILALDGAWRAGYQPQQIIDAMVAKQTKNEGRNWPDWRTVPADKAIEHDRSGEAAPAPASVPVTITPEVAREALNEWDRNTCIHENTHRGGVIWTICDDCGCQWADDRGGFVPYSDPPGIAALRAALSQKPGEQGK